jgi:hypothetical protein
MTSTVIPCLYPHFGTEFFGEIYLKWDITEAYVLQSGVFRNLQINSRIFRAISRNLIGLNVENLMNFYRSFIDLAARCNKNQS